MECAKCFLMKLQLTKTKTIEIGRKGGASSAKVDITGVELFSGDARGCPAVRICLKKRVWHLEAAGFVPPPAGELPEKWDDMPKQPKWEMPAAFQSPNAALSVRSAQAIFAQATADSIVQDMARGLATQKAAPVAEPEKKRFSVKRHEKPAAETAPAAAAKLPDFPPAGLATSANGMRFTVKPIAEAGFHLEAALPEFQALWLSRLLPEGRRPTACSVQVSDAALMASVLAQPAVAEANGNALAVFVEAERVAFAGYKGGEPVLWRICPGSGGLRAMRAAVTRTLGVEASLVDSVLDDTLVDPRGALEPFLRPILDELELSRAYLADRHGISSSRILLFGLPAGAKYWNEIAKDTHRLELVAPKPFDGIVLPTKAGALDDAATGADAAVFLPALGAALAAAEVTE